MGPSTKVSFCTIAYRFLPHRLETCIQDIKAAGYEFVEIWGGHIKKATTDYLLKLADDIHQQGIRVSTVSHYLDFTSGAFKWQQSIDQATVLMQQAKCLQAPYVRCFTGVCSSRQATEAQRHEAVMGIRHVATLAQTMGIKLLIEVHANTLADTGEQTQALLHAIAHPNVGVLFDPFNMWETEGDAWIKGFDALYPLIEVIHLKNATCTAPHQSPFPFVHEAASDTACIASIRTGAIDYAAFCATLTARAFNGFLSIEWFGDEVARAAVTERACLLEMLNASRVAVS